MVLLIRHLESAKNIANSFSSDHDSEKLTELGTVKGIDLAENIYSFVRKKSLSVHNIYCANSTRAISTAEIIANKLGIRTKSFDELRSNKNGILKGKNEAEAANLNPTFMKQLKLFRAGVFSSYDFVKLYEREDKHRFEVRVNSCIDSILSDNSEDLKIIVLHHSSITAAVIRYARKFYSYPDDFYGHIACDLGNIYLIDSHDILLCDEPSHKLLDI